MKLPANVLLFKFNNKNSRIRFEVCSKLTIKNNFIDVHCTKKMKFSIKNFFSKCDQIRIWSHLPKKSLIENFILYAVKFGNLPIVLSGGMNMNMYEYLKS